MWLASAQPASSHTSLPLRPWHDLATLALLAQTQELIGEPDGPSPTSLCSDSLARLENVAGARPPFYWEDLLHYGLTLRLFVDHERRWDLHTTESEILGATRRECSPALNAAWLRNPTPVETLRALTTSSDPMQQLGLRMEIIKLVEQLDGDLWYPTHTLTSILQEAARRQNVELTFDDPDAAAQALLSRVLVVIGVASTNDRWDHFSLRTDVQTPLTRHSQTPKSDPEVAAFRRVLSQTFAQNHTWRSVGPDLQRCVEVRRQRQASSDSLFALDHAQHSRHKAQLATDPTIPFKDCLFLARFARLAPLGALSCGRHMAPGSYIFELDTDAVQQRVAEGTTFEEIDSFLKCRCTAEHYGRLRRILSETRRA